MEETSIANEDDIAGQHDGQFVVSHLHHHHHPQFSYDQQQLYLMQLQNQQQQQQQQQQQHLERQTPSQSLIQMPLYTFHSSLQQQQQPRNSVVGSSFTFQLDPPSQSGGGVIMQQQNVNSPITPYSAFSTTSSIPSVMAFSSGSSSGLVAVPSLKTRIKTPTTTTSPNSTSTATTTEATTPPNASMHERRLTHNAIERARRDNFNIKLREMAREIPTLAGIKKPSKNQIVSKTLDYLQNVNQELTQCYQRIDELVKRVELLQEENSQLKTINSVNLQNVYPRVKISPLSQQKYPTPTSATLAAASSPVVTATAMRKAQTESGSINRGIPTVVSISDEDLSQFSLMTRHQSLSVSSIPSSTSLSGHTSLSPCTISPAHLTALREMDDALPIFAQPLSLNDVQRFDPMEATTFYPTTTSIFPTIATLNEQFSNSSNSSSISAAAFDAKTAGTSGGVSQGGVSQDDDGGGGGGGDQTKSI